MPKKKSIHGTDDKPKSNKQDALLFAAKLVENTLEQKKTLGKFIQHVSELEAARMINQVEKIQRETPDSEKKRSTPQEILTFFRPASQKSPRPVADPLLEKGAKGPARKKPKV